MNYRPTLDLSTIPDEVLYAELARRRVAKRTRAVGPPPVLTACAWCGEQFGAREMRKHRPRCPAKAVAKSNGSPKPSTRR